MQFACKCIRLVVRSLELIFELGNLRGLLVDLLGKEVSIGEIFLQFACKCIRTPLHARQVSGCGLRMACRPHGFGLRRR